MGDSHHHESTTLGEQNGVEKSAAGSTDGSTVGTQKRGKRRRQRAKISLPPANAPGVLQGLPQLPDHMLDLVRKGKMTPEEYQAETERRQRERRAANRQHRRSRARGGQHTSDGASVRSASVMSVGIGSVAASEATHDIAAAHSGKYRDSRHQGGATS